MSVGELACTYASLLLHGEEIPITAENISSLVKAADVKIDAYWPGLFAKLFEKRSIEDLIMNVGSCGVAVAVAAPVAEAAAPEAVAPAKEEKRDVDEEESDEDMNFSLFDE